MLKQTWSSVREQNCKPNSWQKHLNGVNVITRCICIPHQTITSSARVHGKDKLMQWSMIIDSITKGIAEQQHSSLMTPTAAVQERAHSPAPQSFAGLSFSQICDCLSPASEQNPVTVSYRPCSGLRVMLHAFQRLPFHFAV